jgi:hypothetical protein
MSIARRRGPGKGFRTETRGYSPVPEDSRNQTAVTPRFMPDSEKKLGLIHAGPDDGRSPT